MITKFSVLFSVSAGMVALLGDFIMSNLSNRWQLAMVDNLTHVLVAFFTWISMSFFHYSSVTTIIIEAMICGAIASLIDTDHFISASSLRLMDATNLKNRPFLHNSTLIVLVFMFTFSLSLLSGFPTLWNLSWIFLAAGLSHHIRDATRRGFWFWPMNHTPAVPYVGYIALQVILPHILKQLIKITVRPYVEGIRVEMV